jgi:FMN phosphatase YigB (HAD superfamily)
MIKVLSFDIGGTLIQFDRKRSLKDTLLQNLNVEPHIFYKAYNDHFTKKKIHYKIFVIAFNMILHQKLKKLF